MATFIVQQTCENKGNTEYIMSVGGILADKTDLFLGRGYYYWEANSDKAYEWGVSHYKGKYFTFEVHLSLDLDLLLDLTFRTYIDFVLKMIKIYARTHKIPKTIKIGAFIDFIRDLQDKEQKEYGTKNSEYPFPFLYSRAVDYTDTPNSVKDRMEFTDREGISNYFLLKPCSFFCVYDLGSVTLTNKRLLRVLPIETPL